MYRNVYDKSIELFNAIKESSQSNVVGVEVFFNHEGFEIKYITREYENLKRSNISMRNIKGDFIGK